MDKSYKRVNWSNDTSKKTFLNDTNLNVMDKGIDVLDDRIIDLDSRILELEGYEEEAKESAENADVSEANAKTSENNAKASEELAKEYMEKAFTSTPEGYEALVDTVRLMDIATSTDYTYPNSKHGGYRLLELEGNTEQNGEPSPDNPQSINNEGDCVEMIQGGYGVSNGAWVSLTNYVCSKNPIPCASGDVIKVNIENLGGISCLFYNDSGYLRYSAKSDTNIAEFTVPSDATRFHISISNASAITPSTVGKITLTINGKYVNCVKSHGKNFLNHTFNSATWGGVTMTVNADKTITLNGTSTSQIDLYLLGSQNSFAPISTMANGEKYIINGKNNTSLTWRLIGSDGVTNVTATSNEREFTYSNDLKVILRIPNGVTLNNVVVSPMIRSTSVTDDTYEPYQETVAYFLTEKPMMDDSVLFREDGLFKVEHGGTEIVFDGSADEGWYLESEGGRMVTIVYDDYIKRTVGNSIVPNALCSHYGVFSANDTFQKVTGISYGTVGAIQVYDPRFTTLAEWLVNLTNNPIILKCELATPTIEVLDTASQIALNSLETFDTVTYIEVDSRVKPSGIKGEYGTSQVGAYTLKSLNNTETNAIRLNELAVAMVSLGSEV